jgi:iron-sulfur cluster repair protein YtfE (RIC family)
MKLSETLQWAIADHAAASEFVRNLDATMAIWNTKETGVKIQAIRAYIQKHVTEHFAYEDEAIYNALLAANPDADIHRVVTGLQNDHRAITKEVEQLNELLAQVEHGAGVQTIGQLDLTFRMLLGRLQRHAAEEDKLFAALSAK